MVTASFDAILALDDAGRTLAFNPAAERIFGYDAASVMDRCAADFLVPDDVRDTHPLVRITAGRGMDQPPIKRGRLRTRALRRSGESFAAEFSIDLAPSPAGAVWVIFARDISDSIAREQQLKQARDTALAGDRAKARFLAVMSHEIRTPLNGLLGSLDLLADTNLSPEQARHLTVLQTSGQLLMQHVNDVLDLSQVESGRLQLELVPVDLQQLMEDLVDGQLPVARAGGNRLDFRILGPAPDLVEADPRRIGQIVLNLLSNALKFTKQGAVTLTIKLEDTQGQTGACDTACVHFSVRDSGMGISDAARSEIFKAFSQAEPGTARKYGGTGLGLTISQRLLELMNSRIHLWSEEGVGSEFSFTLELPVVPASNPLNNNVVHSNMDPAQPDQPVHGLGQASSTLRILVAEDNMVNQAFVSHVLTQLGISYRFADDGLAAVQVVDEETFDLVFMDMHMPNMGGLEACRTILAQDKHRDLPIVGLTADAIAETRDACMAAGMKEYISKPFRRSDIENVLTRLNFKIAPIPMQNFDHDRELLKTTIDMIAAEVPKLLEETELHLRQAQWLDAKRALHTLKGHCKLIGEMDFAGFLQGLENQLVKQQCPPESELSHLHSNIKALQHRLKMLSQ